MMTNAEISPWASAHKNSSRNDLPDDPKPFAGYREFSMNKLIVLLENGYVDLGSFQRKDVLQRLENE